VTLADLEAGRAPDAGGLLRAAWRVDGAEARDGAVEMRLRL
jgi:hypothetical protein